MICVLNSLAPAATDYHCHYHGHYHCPPLPLSGSYLATDHSCPAAKLDTKADGPTTGPQNTDHY